VDSIREGFQSSIGLSEFGDVGNGCPARGEKEEIMSSEGILRGGVESGPGKAM
jgi:hypothetical protein